MQRARGHRSFLSVSASSGSNLKALLKAIIQKATARSEGLDDDEDELQTAKKGPKLLNYDLQILHDCVGERQLQQVIIALHDSEAFDGELLSELIELLGCWQDRIPFVLLFNIATSLDFLQQRLSKAAVKCLQGTLFDVAPVEDMMERLFDTLISSRSVLCIGPNLIAMLLERQSDYIQSIESFVDAVKYAYMCSYYANALSIFLDSTMDSADVPEDHYEGLRNLKSFRDHCQDSLDRHDAASLRRLLDDNEFLDSFVRQKISQGRAAMNNITDAVSVVHALQEHTHSQHPVPKSKLYVQATSNKLKESSLLRSLLLTIRKSPSNTVLGMFDAIARPNTPRDLRDECVRLRKDLNKLIKNQVDGQEPLRSEDDVKNSTLRTTVVAQKVELSKQKASLSKQDAEYTAILRRFTDALEAFFEQALIDPKSLLFHEIFIYDLKSPHREVFMPRPRHAIERALAAPHDYLDCECCSVSTLP